MTSPTILLADNDKDYLLTCSEFLESAGYQVLMASNPIEAASILNSRNIHLCVFDLRLTDDNNDNDRSGLNLTKDVARAVPKIVLTRFPTFEDVVSAMKIKREELPFAVDFVDKRKGLEVLLVSVRQAFLDYVQINWNLRIDWKARDAFGIVKFLEPDVQKHILLDHVDEFTDLLGNIFRGSDRVRLDAVIWQTKNRIAITAFSFRDGGKPESFLLICGLADDLREETHHFTTYSPKNKNGSLTSLILSGKTSHYGVNLYSLEGNDLEDVVTLLDLYRQGPEKSFNAAVTTLFESTLKRWHQSKAIAQKNKSIIALLSKCLKISESHLSSEFLFRQLSALEHHAASIGITVKKTSKGIALKYSSRSFLLSNPFTLLGEKDWPSALTIDSPGNLTGNNILADAEGNIWLTDFADAGPFPVLWNFVSLESSIRFDWLENIDPIRSYDMENCLVYTDFSKPDVRSLEQLLRKPARGIELIRKLAFNKSNKDIFMYNLGVFFHGLGRFVNIDFQSPLTSAETYRAIHVLVSLCLISAYLQNTGNDLDANQNDSGYPTLRIDADTRTVFMGSRKHRLSARLFKLLLYLYDNSDRICSTDELRVKVVGDNYNATYIHTLIGRIRDEIEEETEHPVYLVNESGIGYRLIINPE